ncbi:MAG: DNA-directed DNA polymerase II small subunit [Candidatus Heimdallarchaeota archaeon]|nr:DNA-directed DNA polymerase II small subunit [Candidatus Heimdallarchaeota archaeon]MCK5049582.1 DNA-directed DNA polymerase II small subunit [Candidatus Heimdallarchaeota archaeon]
MPSDLKNLISQLLVVGFTVTPASLTPLKKISPSLFPKIISYLKINQNKGNTLTQELLQEIIDSLNDITETKASKANETIPRETQSNAVETEARIEPTEKSEKVKRSKPSEIEPDHPTSKPISSHLTKDYIDSKLEIIFDPTENLTTSGELDDFLDYFTSRYNKLKRIIQKRTDLPQIVPIKDLTNSKEKSCIIGIVNERRKTASGGLLIDLEDNTGNALAIVSQRNEDLLQTSNRVIPDEIIAIIGTKNRDLFYVNQIIWPDIPYNFKPKKAKEEVYAAFISDLHVGSHEFLDSSLNRFTRFLNGYGDLAQDNRSVVSKIKYLLIGGDTIDGVGVYPGQEADLKIKTPQEQYDLLADYIKEIPQDIEIVIIPGNHDMTSIAEPQPAILPKYARKITELPNTHMLGNPSYIRIHGVCVLMAHGTPLGDLTSFVPGLSMAESAEAMKELLVSRHLAPTYGNRTSLVPTKEDFLVISPIPDIFHTGHTHCNAYGNYRGVTLINSGTFQGQTDFQKNLGIIPTPAEVPIINLNTLKITKANFNKS